MGGPFCSTLSLWCTISYCQRWRSDFSLQAGDGRIYAALGIRKEQIDKRQAWQSYIESHFNTVRKMVDAKFARATSWEEVLSVHRSWMRDYNAQRHFAHEKREDECHSPAHVLGEQKGAVYPASVLNRDNLHRSPLYTGQKGAVYPASVLNRILFATRYTRQLNQFGYLRVQGWKLYGEAGLSGSPVTVWATMARSRSNIKR